MTLKNPDLDDTEYSFLDEASIHFFQAVKEHYTRDTAVDVINSLQEILGKDWSGRVIFNMMSDRYQNIVGLALSYNESFAINKQKISAIKLFRSLTGSGLTEAKVAVELSEDRLVTFRLQKPANGITSADWNRTIHTAIREFGQFGYRAEIYQPSAHGILGEYGRI